jgi:drug/metabolite transporter (DMT)-like permease
MDQKASTSSDAATTGALSLRSIGAMLLLAVMWGLSIPVTKLGLATLPPLTLTALRFAIAVPLLLFLARGRLRIPRTALLRAALLGALGIGIGQVAQTFGVLGTTASVGTILSATLPLFIVIFAALRLGQRVTGRQRLGLVCAFIGMVLVAGGQGEGGVMTGGTTLSGVAWMLISCVTIAYYFVWSYELTRDHGVVTMAAWSTLFGFLMVLPWAFWEMAHVPVSLTGEALVAAAYLGVVVTALGLFLWLHILRHVPAGIAASVQYLQPVVGIAAATLMFNDRLGLAFALGAALILAGLGLALVKSGR